MSLIIKGMKLPEKCEDCPCYDYIDYVCRADDCFAPFDVENPEERSEHCPLIELPAKHGRLIDADKLLESFREALNEDRCFVNFFALVDDSPTVIEAENESEARKWARDGRDISKGLQEGIVAINSEVPE